ncbi:MAG: hypothetical protein QM703_29925 [Gemmatales bacterium]
MESYVKNYQRKRDWVLKNLDPRYDVVKPEGAFYLFQNMQRNWDRTSGSSHQA